MDSQEIIQPFEEDKYTIADAPSKPLFTMEHHEPEININHPTFNSEGVIEPNVIQPVEDEISPSITQEYNNYQFNDIPDNFEIPEDVDISLLKQENPTIDDIYLNDVDNEETTQALTSLTQTATIIDEDAEEDNEDEEIGRASCRERV